jgi:hypothetical protein
MPSLAKEMVRVEAREALKRQNAAEVSPRGVHNVSKTADVSFR